MLYSVLILLLGFAIFSSPQPGREVVQFITGAIFMMIAVAMISDFE